MSISKPSNWADWASILTPVLLVAGAFYGNALENKSEAHTDAAVAALRQECTANLETKAEHNSDIVEIKQAQKELVAGQEDIKINVQRIADRSHIPEN